MASYLLDTDAIIDYLFGIPSSVALLQGLQSKGDLLCVCDVVTAEVYAGLKPEHREPAERLLNACMFLGTGPEAAKQAGEWRYAYARQGVVLATTDVLIAATAHAHQATVVTGNAGDYPMPEVAVFPLPRAKR